jgi:uncharacterized integral membrane protein
MKTLLKWIVLAPLAAVLLVFALVNRQAVTVTFDPFDGTSPALAVTAPLFVVLGLAAMIGVIIGGIATWFGQARHRRAARQARAELERLRAENARLSAAARERVTPLAIPRAEAQRSAA